ncbi:MAG: hypothetical protein HWN80_14170 [Candidatus Lokiarchaeota archaeon]|nr:hypothetical protein [Candidatus Lokiarchaeota archaeon]
MAVIKEEVISILRELPDDTTLVEIERAIIIKTLPFALPHSKKVEKQIHKFEKLNRELTKLIKKTELNPRYLQETIPIQNVRNSFNIERDFHIR